MDRDFWLGLRHPRVARAIWKAERWWRPYGPETNADRIDALAHACEYWYGAAMHATQERDELRARVAAMTEERKP